MVEYPEISNASGIAGILSFPNAIYPYFWLWILGGLWLIISLTLYFTEKERKGTGNFISSMAVSCLAIILLATIGSIVGFVSLEIMVYIIIFSFIIIGIWFFSGR